MHRPPAPKAKKERALRQPMYRQGALLFESGQRMTVAIKDLSDTGARIEFLVRQALPPEVTLVEPTLRLRKRARVAWQTENIAGLEFYRLTC